jgi:hypothetical protein
MMIAIPAEHWRVFGAMSPARLARVLKGLAVKVNLGAFRKHPRGPKRPVKKKPGDKRQPHVATARLLAERDRAHPRTK